MAKTDIKPMEKYNGPLVRLKKRENNYAPFIVLQKKDIPHVFGR